MKIETAENSKRNQGYKLYKTLNFQFILSCFSSAGNSACAMQLAVLLAETVVPQITPPGGCYQALSQPGSRLPEGAPLAISWTPESKRLADNKQRRSLTQTKVDIVEGSKLSTIQELNIAAQIEIIKSSIKIPLAPASTFWVDLWLTSLSTHLGVKLQNLPFTLISEFAVSFPSRIPQSLDPVLFV